MHVISPTVIERRKTADARLRYRALLQEEIVLLEQMSEGYQKKIDMGFLSPTGPEMLAWKRDILELKRTLGPVNK